MADKIIRYVPTFWIPGATPGKAGGNIAVVVDDLVVSSASTVANLTVGQRPWPTVRRPRIRHRTSGLEYLGHEVPMTAAQYRTQEFAKIRALELWKEVRFLQPTEIHPDDFRALYPELPDLTNVEIRKRLERVAGAIRTRPGVGFLARPVTSGSVPPLITIFLAQRCAGHVSRSRPRSTRIRATTIYGRGCAA